LMATALLLAAALLGLFVAWPLGAWAFYRRTLPRFGAWDVVCASRGEVNFRPSAPAGPFAGQFRDAPTGGRGRLRSWLVPWREAHLEIIPTTEILAAAHCAAARRVLRARVGRRGLFLFCDENCRPRDRVVAAPQWEWLGGYAPGAEPGRRQEMDLIVTFLVPGQGSTATVPAAVAVLWTPPPPRPPSRGGGAVAPA
jgi:hypothetical protein